MQKRKSVIENMNPVGCEKELNDIGSAVRTLNFDDDENSKTNIPQSQSDDSLVVPSEKTPSDKRIESDDTPLEHHHNTDAIQRCLEVPNNLQNKHEDCTLSATQGNSCSSTERKPNICINQSALSLQTESKKSEKKQPSRGKVEVPPDDIIDNMDEINELLMDILEEIEAKRITVEECVGNLHSRGIIDEIAASCIVPSFNVNPAGLNTATVTDKTALKQDDAKDIDDSLKKLLNILPNLGLETLAKCHRCILQIAHDNYKAMLISSTPKTTSRSRRRRRQDRKPPKAPTNEAVRTSDELNQSQSKNPHEFKGMSQTTKNTVITNDEATSSQVSIQAEISSLDHSDTQSKPKVKSNVTCNNQFTEAIISHGPVLTTVQPSKPKDSNPHSFSKPLRFQRLNSDRSSVLLSRIDINIRRTLSLLVDQRTLEVKQMWLIMNMDNEAEQALHLRLSLDKLSEVDLNCLYKIRGLEWLEDLMSDPTLINRSLGHLSCSSHRKSLGFKKTSVGSVTLSTDSSPNSSLKSSPTSPIPFTSFPSTNRARDGLEPADQSATFTQVKSANCNNNNNDTVYRKVEGGEKAILYHLYLLTLYWMGFQRFEL